MHNKEFERQVQQKTEGLKITPSEGMWDKIEAQLPPQKKKRRPLVWLLALLLAGGSTAIWFVGQEGGNSGDKPVAQLGPQQSVTYPSPPQQPLSDDHQALAKPSSTPLAPSTASVPQQGTGATNTSLDTTARQQRTVRDDGKVHVKIGKPPADIAVIADNANDGTTNKNVGADNQMDMAQKQQKTIRLPISATSKAVQMTMVAGQVDTMGLAQTFVAESAIEKLSVPHFLTIASDPAAIDMAIKPIKAVPVELLPLPPTTATKTSNAKRGWEWGLTVGAGLSNRADNLLWLKNNLNAMDMSVGGLVNPGVYAPNISKIKPGIAYHVGLYLQKPIGKRWHLQTGLSYNYLSNKQAVGSLVQDPLRFWVFGQPLAGGVFTSNNYRGGVRYSSFFRPGNSRVYTNRIHLLQLPIELQYRFGQRNQWGLFTGVSIGYMMPSKILVYDAANVSYFTSRELYNRMQLSVQTGAAFYPKQQSSFAVGMRINYNITSFVSRQAEIQRMLSGLLYCNIPLKKK
jgi:hypothetical protein